MPDKNDISPTIINIIASQPRQQHRKDPITPATTMAELDLDVVDLIEITMDLEEEFHCTLVDDIIDKIQSVGELIAYLETTACPQEPEEPTPTDPSPPPDQSTPN